MAKKKTAAKTAPPPDFEKALQELETIVQRLEQGGGSLENALEDYSTAIGLMKLCHQKLEHAERRVEILSGVDAEGNPVVERLEDSETTLEEKRQTRSSRRSSGSSRQNSSRKKADSPSEEGLF